MWELLNCTRNGPLPTYAIIYIGLVCVSSVGREFMSLSARPTKWSCLRRSAGVSAARDSGGYLRAMEGGPWRWGRGHHFTLFVPLIAKHIRKYVPLLDRKLGRIFVHMFLVMLANSSQGKIRLIKSISKMKEVLGSSELYHDYKIILNFYILYM